MKTKSTNPETQRKLERRNSVHSTTNRQRKTSFIEACYGHYRVNEGLGGRKRKLRELKAENPKGYKALLLDKETDSKGC